MKKIFLLISIILIVKLTLSQTTTYNKLYAVYPNNPNYTFTSSSIINNGYKYFIVGCGRDTINSNFQSLIFCKLDSAGNVNMKFMLTKTGWNYYPEVQTLIKSRNGGFLYLGQKDTANYNPEHILIRFDDNLDTIWTKTLHNEYTAWEAFWDVKETSDNGLIFAGAVELSLNNLGILLVKTDSLANQIWRKTLYLPDINGGSKIIELPDKGFLIKGFRETQVTGDGGPFLLKTDSLGNQQWYKEIGGNEYDGSASIALTNDSNILVAYGYSTYSFPDNESWSAKLNVIKYKLDGTEIWNKFYETINRSLETLKIHQRDKTWEMAEQKGNYIIEKLKTYVGDKVVDVRGMGMEIGLLFKDVETSDMVRRKSLADGLHIIIGSQSNMQIMPPLTISQKLIDEALEILTSHLK